MATTVPQILSMKNFFFFLLFLPSRVCMTLCHSIYKLLMKWKIIDVLKGPWQKSNSLFSQRDVYHSTSTTQTKDSPFLFPFVFQMHNLQPELSCFHLALWTPGFLTGSVKHSSELYLRTYILYYVICTFLLSGLLHIPFMAKENNLDFMMDRI